MAASSRNVYKQIDQCSSPVVNRSLITSFAVGKHFINVVCNGTTLIYFFKQKKRMVIYKLPGKLLCCCIAIINEKKTLICGLEDGKICAIHLKDLIKHKKRKHVVKSDSSEDIFAGLLECETVPSVAETHSSNSDDVQELDENSVVLKVKNLVELLMIGRYLFTASSEGDKILISAFQHKATTDDMKEKKDSSCICFEKLHGSERIFKCQSSPSIDMHQCTKMYCVVSESIATAHQFHKAVVIKDELFNEIFGTEYNILESCMILVGLPDGAIFTLPFKDVSNFSAAQISTGNCFYNIRQPLALICAITYDNTHKQQVGDTLVLLGREGKLLLIGLKKDDVTRRVVFKECYVQEPVQAAVQVRSSMLLYSTEKELLQLHFSQQSDREIISDSFSSYDLGITQVVALSEVYYDKGQDDVSIGNVFVLTSRGKIGNVQNPNAILNTTSSDSADSTGEKIQELLSAINNLATEMEAIKNSSRIHNIILLELNKACHVASEVTSPNKVHPSLFSDANLQIDALGTSKELSVICSVTNHSKFTMSCGWSFHIMIIGEHDWFSQSNQPHAVICKSIPLSAYHPGERRELKVNLTNANICLPIDITLAVHFDASNLVDKLNQKETLVTEINLHNSSIIVPVTSLHFDILDVLKPMTLPVAGNSFSTTTTSLFQPKYGSPKASSWTVGWMMESMQSLAKFKLPAKEPVISDSLTINLHFKTISLHQIIASKDGLNSEKFFRWLLPSATNHLPPGVLTNQVAMTTISPEGYQVTFTLSMNGEETSITLQTKHIQVLCKVVLAVHLKMKNCLQRIQKQGFILEEVHERVKNLKEICDRLEEFKSTKPSSSNVQAPSQHEIQQLMQIYINARSHLI